MDRNVGNLELWGKYYSSHSGNTFQIFCGGGYILRIPLIYVINPWMCIQSGQITIFHGSWVEIHISRYGIKQGRGDLMKIWGRAPRKGSLRHCGSLPLKGRKKDAGKGEEHWQWKNIEPARISTLIVHLHITSLIRYLGQISSEVVWRRCNLLRYNPAFDGVRTESGPQSPAPY